jgi:hypothetical protein
MDKVRALIFTLTFAYVSLTGLALYHFPNQKPWEAVLFFTLLGILFSRLEVSLRFGRLTMSFVAHLAASLALPPGQAALVGALGYLGPRPVDPWKETFNRTQLGLSALSASLGSHLLNPLVGGLAYFLVNLGTITLIGTLLGRTPKALWVESFRSFLPSYLGLFPVSVLMAALYQNPLVFPWSAADTLLAAFPVIYVYILWRYQIQLAGAINNIVEASVRYLEAKDPYTAFHSDRVAAIARDIALEMGLPPDQVSTVQTGAKLHDIGKLKVPETLLRKEGRLSQEEWLNITKHPEYGVVLLKPLEPFLGEVFPIVLHHHERWDGRGYPHKKAGYEIPLFARIVAVADAYEAMTSDRPYRRAKRPEEALQEIQDLAGIQFDPRVVEAFTRAWRKNPPWRDKSEYVRNTIF